MAELNVSIARHHRYLVVEVSPFASETEALEFLPLVKAGLWNLAIEHNIAFDPDFNVREITRAEDPEAAGKNIGESFGIPDIGPVHGLADEGGTTVYPSDETIRFMGFGDVSFRVSTSLDKATRTLKHGMERGSVGNVDNGITTAADLYLSHFYETTLRARFLTLMTVLEVLAPVTQKHPLARAMIERWKLEVQRQLNDPMESESRDALEALDRELEFRKETSIRRRIRRLVLDTAPLEESARKELAKEVVDAYDLRGSLVHSGAIGDAELHAAYEVALSTAKLLLRVKLGLIEQAGSI
ncbi:MAG TPA: hypothetical protein VF092_02590 [Longimicrobium sp.]